MTYRRAACCAASLLACAAALVGCREPVAPSARSSESSAVIQPTPAVNQLTSGVAHTRGLGTAALIVDAAFEGAGAVGSLHGSGAVSLSSGFGDMTWTDGDATWRELSNGRGTYIRDDPAAGTWTLASGSSPRGTARLTDPLRGLGALDQVVDEGTEVVSGVELTRFRGRLPADAAGLALVGLAGPDRTALVDAAHGSQIDVTVWTDDRDRIVRVDREIAVPNAPGGPVSARTSTRLSDFTVGLNLTSPPSAEVAQS